MDTNKAVYWIALGVLALGLNSEYRQGHFEKLHWVADRAGFVVCHLTTRAEQTLALAKLLMGSQQSGTGEIVPPSVADEIAQAESVRVSVRDNVREQVRAAQTEIERAQIRQIRSVERSQVRLAHMVSRRAIVCRTTGARVMVSDDMDSDDSTE
jgi:hypothetical protein